MPLTPIQHDEPCQQFNILLHHLPSTSCIISTTIAFPLSQIEPADNCHFEILKQRETVIKRELLLPFFIFRNKAEEKIHGVKQDIRILWFELKCFKAESKLRIILMCTDFST